MGWGYSRSGSVLVMLGAISSALILFFIHAPGARAVCGTASSSPCPPTPSPIPVHAFLSLDVTSGNATTVINVTGGQFLPNETVSLYWDDASRVAGGATADGGGSFNTRVKPFSSDSPGIHKLCASVAPNPCANFTLLAAVPSPAASPSPSPSTSPSPDQTPSDQAAASPPATLSGLGVIMSPPFVFLPIAGVLFILLSVGYWLVNRSQRPRVAPLPSASVVHRAMRPDYSAGFGAPPTPPAPTEPAAPAPPSATTPPAQDPEWGPPVEWGTGSSGGWGFPEPPPSDDDSPENPQPKD